MYRLYVDGQDRTSEWLIRTGSTIGQQLGSPQTATLSLEFAHGSSTRPELNSDVLLVEAASGYKLFGGLVASYEETMMAGTNRCTLRLNCSGYGSLLSQRIIGAYYEPNAIAWTPALMVADMLREYIPETGINWAGGDGGTEFGTEVIVQYQKADQAIKQVLDPWGLDYFVDANKNLYVIDPATGYGAAPFDISEADGHVMSDGQTVAMTVRSEGGTIVTRVAVRSDLRLPPMWHDKWAYDPSAAGFYPTKYRITDKPVVLEDGEPKIVGAYAGAAVESDYTYVPDGYGVSRVAGTGGAAHDVEIIYPIPLQPVHWVEDAAAISQYGIREALVEAKDRYTVDQWEELGQGELDRRGGPTYSIEYRTRSSNRFRPGMAQIISHTKPYVPLDTYVIDGVNGNFIATADGGFWDWTISASNKGVTESRNSARTQKRIIAGLDQPQDRHRQVFAWDIAKTVDGLDNPGVSAMDLHQRHVITRVGFLYEVRLRFDTAPADVVEVDVYLTRGDAAPVSIFANGQKITFLATDDGTIVKSYDFASQPYALQIGDVLTAETITGDTTAKDGILEVEQQG